MNDEEEVWKPIAGYPRYEVSNLGFLRNAPGASRSRLVKPIKGHPTIHGYLQFALYNNAKSRHLTAHRVVWETFVGPVPSGFELDHVNGDKQDNRLSNLEAVTRQENIRRALATGLTPTGDRHWARRLPERVKRGEQHWSRSKPERICRGERQGTSKLTEDAVRDIRRRVDNGEERKNLAKEYAVDRSLIDMIMRRVAWKHVL